MPLSKGCNCEQFDIKPGCYFVLFTIWTLSLSAAGCHYKADRSGSNRFLEKSGMPPFWHVGMPVLEVGICSFQTGVFAGAGLSRAKTLLHVYYRQRKPMYHVKVKTISEVHWHVPSSINPFGTFFAHGFECVISWCVGLGLSKHDQVHLLETNPPSVQSTTFCQFTCTLTPNLEKHPVYLLTKEGYCLFQWEYVEGSSSYMPSLFERELPFL